MAHPVRPDSYIEINNFYTATVYEKGAEVVRMMHTLVGRDGFRRGHEAVLPAPRRPGRDLRRLRPGHRRRQPGLARWPRLLTQFERWYAQAGTPRLARPRRVRRRRAQLHAARSAQSLPATPGQAAQAALVLIPVALGLLGRRRPAAAAAAAGRGQAAGARARAGADRGRAELAFIDVTASPCPRCCAASRRRWCWTMACSDADAAGPAGPRHRPLQPLGGRPAPGAATALLAAVAPRPGRRWRWTSAFMRRAARTCCADAALDPAFKDLALTLPAESYIAEQLARGRPAAHPRRCARPCACQLAAALHADWVWAFDATRYDGGYCARPGADRPARAGQPGADACCAGTPRRSGDAVWPGRRLPALQGRRQHDRPPRRPGGPGRQRRRSWPTPALARFHALVQGRGPGAGQVVRAAGRRAATRAGGQVLARVQAADAATRTSRSRNPNRARSLIFSCCTANPAAFHRADAARLCVLGRAGAGAGRHQPAGRRPPGPRAGPLDASWPSPTAAPPAKRIARVAAKPDLSERRARSRSDRAAALTDHHSPHGSASTRNASSCTRISLTQYLVEQQTRARPHPAASCAC